MTAPALSPVEIDRLVKLCGLFSSDYAGERASAAAMADRLLRQHGLSWSEIICVPVQTPWREMAAWCRAHAALFNSTERAFIRAMADWHGQPSVKQEAWLIDLFLRAGGAAR
jgi:hypothetical protein